MRNVARIFILILGTLIGYNGFAQEIEPQPGDSIITIGQDTTAVEDTLEASKSDSLVKESAVGDTLIVAAEEVDIDTVLRVGFAGHSPAGAMWRSFFFPGWGQYYNRKYLKAALIAGAEFSLIYGIWHQEQMRLDAKEQGNDEAARFYRDDRQRLTWWLAFVVLYSMADAYVDAHLINFNVSEDLSAGIGPGLVYVKLKL